MEEKTGVVASVTGATADDTLAPVNLELLLLPLVSPVARPRRACIGALAPLAAPYWLGAKAIGPLTLGMFRHLGARSKPVDAALHGRRRPAAARPDGL